MTFDALAATDTDGILKDFLTEPELAKELGVCRMTVRRWRSLGEAPQITRIGRRILYRREAVQSWLESRQVDLEGA